MAYYAFYVTKADMQRGMISTTNVGLFKAFGGSYGLSLEAIKLLLEGLRVQFKKATFQQWQLVGHVILSDEVTKETTVAKKAMARFLVPVDETVYSIDDIGLARWERKSN